MPHPKKVILLVSPDPQILSERSFLLQMHGYKVLRAATFKQATASIALEPYDLLFTEHQLDIQTGEDLAAFSKKYHPYIPVVISAKAEERLETSASDASLMPSIPAVELLERIRLMVARKRGPRKGVLHSQHSGTVSLETEGCPHGAAQ